MRTTQTAYKIICNLKWNIWHTCWCCEGLRPGPKRTKLTRTLGSHGETAYLQKYFIDTFYNWDFKSVMETKIGIKISNNWVYYFYFPPYPNLNTSIDGKVCALSFVKFSKFVKLSHWLKKCNTELRCIPILFSMIMNKFAT